MSETINIQEILKEHGVYIESLNKLKTSDGNKSNQRDRLTAALVKIVEAVIDKCKEKAETTIDSAWNTIIDRRSILNVKNLISYE